MFNRYLDYVVKIVLSKKYFKYIMQSLVAIVGIFLCFYMFTFKPEVKHQVVYKISDNKAEEYFYNSDYSKAITEYENISAKDKGNGWWLVKISEVYSVKGDLVNSRKYIDSAKKLASADKNAARKAKILNYIVFTELMNKDFKQALDDGSSAIKTYPKNESLIKTMFSVYMDNGQNTDASKLISNYPVNKKSAYDMAEYSRMLMLVGRWDEGFTELRKAWSIDKDEYKIYDVLSQTYNYNKDILLDKITTLSSKNVTDSAYAMWLAKIYSMSADTSDEADSLLVSLKGKNIGNIEVKLIQAAIYQNENQSAKADELFNSVIKKYPNDYRVLHTAGWYYLNKKDYDNALKYCKLSIIKNKDYPDNYGFLMPEILRGLGKGIEGEPYFRIAMSKEPYNYNIMVNIGNYYCNNSQNFAKAIEYYKFAEMIKPQDAEIKYSMALAYLSSKDVKNCIKILTECTTLVPSEPKYHRTLSTVYMTQGDYDKAYGQIKLAYAADEQDILTLSNAGCYYITYKNELQRGFYNFQKAYEGINKLTDSYTKSKITENYNAAKKLLEDYNNGKGNESLKIPNFTLFY